KSCSLDKELKQNLALRCAHRFPHADFARSIRNRNHHDRHHANSTDHQSNTRQHDHHEEKHAGDLVERIQNLILRDHVEVVLRCRSQPAHLTQCYRYSFLCIRRSDTLPGLHGDEDCIRLIELKQVVHGEVRHDRSDSLAWRLEDVAGLLIQSDYGHRTATETHLLIDYALAA